MHRFPNPGSDIDSFVRIYQALHEEIGNGIEFTLDDMSVALVKRNLASSSGYMGSEALARSYNKDRSRDKLYNQSKMYAELYRALGWFITGSSKLNFRFSYLGDHIAEAGHNSKPLVEESLVGMAFPNEGLGVKGNHVFRPFLCILRTMKELDGLLCRDEMIVGPQSIKDDRSSQDFEAMIAELKSLRSGKTKIKDLLEGMSSTRRISLNTMGNYTRFPLAVLEWTGWTEKERLKGIIPGQNLVYHRLTKYGAEKLSCYEKMLDVRCADISQYDEDVQKAISRRAFFGMLKRSGFDIESFDHSLQQESKKLPEPFQETDILFSPFQELSSEKLQSYFADLASYEEDEKSTASLYKEYATSKESDALVTNVLINSDALDSGHSKTALWIKGYLAKSSTKSALDQLMEEAKSFNKDQYYPLIADIFNIIGLPCEVSRHGINYQRWDAIIRLDGDSIPIEVKSPGEEIHISVKAVRQALENKVVLLSRKSYPNQVGTISLAIGYLPPKNRSEVLGLVNDINKTYQINIGVLDLQVMLRIAIACLKYNKAPLLEQIKNINGLVDVKSI